MFIIIQTLHYCLIAGKSIAGKTAKNAKRPATDDGGSPPPKSPRTSTSPVAGSSSAGETRDPDWSNFMIPKMINPYTSHEEMQKKGTIKLYKNRTLRIHFYNVVFAKVSLRSSEGRIVSRFQECFSQVACCKKIVNLLTIFVLTYLSS
jgi:hypothetical protein